MIQKSNSKKYWRSLDELQGSDEFDQAIEHDFGDAAPPEMDGLSRRRWLQLMGASLAFGSMAGCRYPDEVIAPFAFRPQGRTPGVPEHFATLLELGGVARPLVSTSYDGRPVKLDGNPEHADSRKASDVFSQAAILELYDPDRSRSPARQVKSGYERMAWSDALNTLKGLLSSGQGVAVLSEPSSSPTWQRLKASFLSEKSGAKWFEFTSVSTDNALQGSVTAFGSPHRAVYALDKADRIVSFDHDFMGVDPAVVRLSADFAKGRDADHRIMNRLYVVESDFTRTGAAADHRLSLRFDQVGDYLAALEAAIDAGPESVGNADSFASKMLATMAKDLLEHRGKSVVMVGDQQPAEVHSRAWRINSKLDNLGKTVMVHARAGEFQSGLSQLTELKEAVDAGSVKTLLVIGGNPVFGAPSDLGLADVIGKIENSFHLGLYRDETSRACKVHLNAAHPLESWGDGRSYDGSICLAQPLLKPLFDGKSPVELLSLLLGAEHAEEHHGHDAAHGDSAHGADHDHGECSVGMAAVHETVKDLLAEDGGKTWDQAIHDGFLAGGREEPVTATPGEMELPAASGAWAEAWGGKELELLFKPSSGIYDGRFANSGWLQELPEFITKLTWDNAALVNPVTAEKLGLEHGKIVNLKAGAEKISLPVYILPGLADGSVVTWLGYGREAAGRVAGDAEIQVDSIGHDVRPLRTSENWWAVPGVAADGTATSYALACTQDHFRIDDVGRDEINRRMGGGDDPRGSELIREGTYQSYEAFMDAHDKGHGHDHGNGHDAGHGHDGDDAHEGDHSHDEKAGHEGDHDSHGHGSHGHHAQWPEGFHLHFENFDLTEAGWLKDMQSDKYRHKWGMSVDLNKCSGCNACVIACQAENNIPVVGKDQVLRGREMHWMRVDRYFITEKDDKDGARPEIASQPVTCQHCESAPCETVCPVAATVHSSEGLNDMVYNRCIGTRYCGNNCPYKVRRFNYFNYTDAETFLKIPGADRLKRANLSLQNMMMNPEVTVRSRGVMEKCTFCVQRIQNAKIKAKSEGNRPLEPNEISVACQDVCAANAISFGDLNNPESDVRKAHDNVRAYSLLEALNIHPRTRYLARVRNPHEDLVPAAEASAH